MTDATMRPNDPIACTLAPTDLADQVLEWTDLAAHALTTESIPNGIASTYPIALADAVEDLARRETACCGSWLEIETERQGDILRLALATNSEQGRAVLTRISGRECGS